MMWKEEVVAQLEAVFRKFHAKKRS
jgi:hypothetical protein